ncbi:MAG TPA: hypothetical protein VFX49_02965 [Chloroflexota bacterium]|nr:hypothetical protein [Chloroflexota bacterium]
MTSTAALPGAEPPARVRLLRELARDGASAEFLRQYFLHRRELNADDLRAVWQAITTHRPTGAPTKN